MRVLITLNMPSAQNYLVHQVTVDIEAKSIDELCEILNESDFIVCRQFYRKKQPDGSSNWLDRGDMIINTSHIGKAQEYVEYTKDHGNDEPYGYFEESRSNFDGARGPIRPRR
jgi:hypothetical protein